MIKYLLLPITIIYYIISELNRLLTKRNKLDIPVISIGNITWGGSGKTPMTIETAKYILSLGKTPVILSRGYARKSKKIKNVIVRDKNNIVADITISGDEPYMMAKQVNCPIIVGTNRLESAKLAKQFNPDVFILDDGFQHWKLQRDLDIVCINSLNPFGNGMIIPSGILREPKSALKRAKIVAITNCNLSNKEKVCDISKEIFKITKEKPIEVSCNKYSISNMFDGSIYTDFTYLRENFSFFVVSAIGSPNNFINTINNLGLQIKEKIIFPDHHNYIKKDIIDIIKNLNSNELVITTAKDAVKINSIVEEQQKRQIYILNISLSFDTRREIFEKKIKSLLGINNEK